jgi:ComF family protein
MRATQGQAADHGVASHGITNRGLARHALAGWAERLLANLFFALFPSDCRICGAPLFNVSRLPVCRSCLTAVQPLRGSYCAVCGEALSVPEYWQEATTATEAAGGEPRCLLCQRVDPPFERAVAYGSYDSQLRDLIHLLKFHQVLPAAAVLGRMLAETIAHLEPGLPVGTVLVVPVPLHRRKLAQRGFNQADRIARLALQEISRPRRFKLDSAVLHRRRETGSQIGLTRHQRRENLRGAFAVSHPTRILNRDILLVDDVFTTGTTVSECARVLLRAGASRVWVATVARTMKISDVVSWPGTEFSVGSEPAPAALGTAI